MTSEQSIQTFKEFQYQNLKLKAHFLFQKSFFAFGLMLQIPKSYLYTFCFCCLLEVICFFCIEDKILLC
jgi:hypothetical protein